MTKDSGKLLLGIIKLQEKCLRLTVKQIAEKPKVSRTFRANYLEIIESNGYNKPKNMLLSKICFNKREINR